MKTIGNLNIQGVKMLTRSQKVGINGGNITQEQCEELGRDGEVVCDWIANRCRCRVIITPC